MSFSLFYDPAWLFFVGIFKWMHIGPFFTDLTWNFPEHKKLFLSVFLQLRFIDTVVERQPKLRRQRCIFTKERGTDERPADSAEVIVFIYLLVDLFMCDFSSREELPQSSPDEHEFRHVGSPDDEHPPSLQLLHHIQLVPLHDPRPGGQQRPPSRWEGASDHHSTATVWVSSGDFDLVWQRSSGHLLMVFIRNQMSCFLERILHVYTVSIFYVDDFKICNTQNFNLK